MKTFTQFREEASEKEAEEGINAILANLFAKGDPVRKREWKNSKIKMNLKDYDGDAFNIRDFSSYSNDMKRAGLDPDKSIRRGIELEWRPQSGLNTKERQQVPNQLLKARKVLPNQMGNTGDVVMQQPVPDKVAQRLGFGDSDAKTGGNKRARLGQMMGFGQLDKGGQQYGILGKTPGGKNKKVYPINPDSKQKVKFGAKDVKHDD
jgi:hypothetical protein